MTFAPDTSQLRTALGACLAALCLSPFAALAANDTLLIDSIDVDGGAATLAVSRLQNDGILSGIRIEVIRRFAGSSLVSRATYATPICRINSSISSSEAAPQTNCVISSTAIRSVSSVCTTLILM